MQDPLRQSRSERRGRLLAAALIGAFALTALARLVAECFRAPIDRVLAFVPDDSLFYFQIAWNFPRTGRFTYDGLHDTYGFQPLWQLVLAFLAHAFEDREAFFRFGLGLLGLLHVAAGLVLARFLFRWAGPVAAVATAVFWFLNPPLLRWSMGGKENVLQLLLLLLLLLHLHALLRGPRAPRGILLGVLAGLLFLSRVNALVCVGLVWLLIACAPGLAARRRARLLLVASLSAGLVVLPWLLYAQATFGSLLPTSGTAKLAGTREYVEDRWGVEWRSWQHVYKAFRMWPGHAGYLWRTLGIPHLCWYFAALVVGAAAGARALVRSGALRAWSARHAAAVPVLAVLVLWSVANGVMVLFFLPQFARYGTWYGAPEALLCGVGFGLLTQAACTGPPSRARTLGLIAALLVALQFPGALDLPVVPLRRAAQAILVVLAAVALLRRDARDSGLRPLALAAALVVTAVNAAPFFHGAYDHASLHSREARGRLHTLGLWAREHLPEDVVLGAWSSGIVAYFSERTVISLEGLVNDLDYLRRGRLDHERYIEETGIEYVFGPGRSHPDGSYSLARLRPGSYDVEWVPFPGYSFFWQGLDVYLLARPHVVKRPPRLEREDFPFGIWRPPVFAGAQAE